VKVSKQRTEKGRGAGQLPTPQELARTAEQFDQEQWFEFLDELDAVSRRRQRRVEEPAPPATAERETMAYWIARKHLVSDSGVREIWYLPQGSPSDEIRLLEVNDRQAMTAVVERLKKGIAEFQKAYTELSKDPLIMSAVEQFAPGATLEPTDDFKNYAKRLPDLEKALSTKN
jgi:hypothetical protein